MRPPFFCAGVRRPQNAGAGTAPIERRSGAGSAINHKSGHPNGMRTPSSPRAIASDSIPITTAEKIRSLDPSLD